MCHPTNAHTEFESCLEKVIYIFIKMLSLPLELKLIIVNFTHRNRCGETFKSLMFTCTDICAVILGDDFDKKVDKMTNHFATLFFMFPDKPWDAKVVAKAYEVPNKPLDLKASSHFMAVSRMKTAAEKEKYFLDLYHGGDKDMLFFVALFTPDVRKFIETCLDTIRPLVMWGLACNDNMTIDILCDYKNIGWQWFPLSSNKAFTAEMVRSTSDLPWDMPSVYRNIYTMSDIVTEKSANKDFCINNNITIYDILAIGDHDMWPPQHVSCRRDITWRVVRDNPDYPWDFSMLFTSITH